MCLVRIGNLSSVVVVCLALRMNTKSCKEAVPLHAHNGKFCLFSQWTGPDTAAPTFLERGSVGMTGGVRENDIPEPHRIVCGTRVL